MYVGVISYRVTVTPSASGLFDIKIKVSTTPPPRPSTCKVTANMIYELKRIFTE